MSKTLQFDSCYGLVEVSLGTYRDSGNLCVDLIKVDTREGVACISMDIVIPVPEDCFYLKDWNENWEIGENVRDSNIFELVPQQTLMIGQNFCDLYSIK